MNSYEKKCYHDIPKSDLTFHPVKSDEPSCWGCSGTGKLKREFGVKDSIYSDVKEVDCPNPECPFKEGVKMEEKELVKQGAEVIVYDPEKTTEEAVKAAKKLKEIVESKPRKVIINNEQYIEFEDWQTVGRYYGYSVKTEDPEPVNIDSIKGAKAKAVVFDRTGVIVGGAAAYCMRDEKNWKEKPWFQLASMAQTRAGAKALRNMLSWVVVLAGYKTTPAEEMANSFPESDTSAPKPIRIKDPGAPATEAQIKAAMALCKKIGDIMKESDFKSMTKQEISDYISNAQKV